MEDFIKQLEEKIKVLEEKVANLENQSYITYLQVNSTVKQLAEKGSLDTDVLISDMDELNKKLVEAVEEAVKSETVTEEEGA